MQRESKNPIFLYPEQFAALFNSNVRESIYLEEIQERDLSFAAPKNDDLNQSSHMNNSTAYLPEIKKPDVVIVPKQTYEQFQNLEQQNKLISESYQRVLKQNKELLDKRKQLEQENQSLLEENFDLKRQTTDLQQKLVLVQNQMSLKRDLEVQSLKKQIKELQLQCTSRDSATKTEISTSASQKSYQGSHTNRVQSNEQSKYPSRLTSPVPKQNTSEFNHLNQYHSTVFFTRQQQF